MKNKGKLRLLALALAVATMLQTGLMGNAVYAFAEEFGARYVTGGVGERQGNLGLYSPAQMGSADSGDQSTTGPLENFDLDSGMLRGLAAGPFIYFSDVKATSTVKVPGSDNEYEPLDSGMARDGIFRVEYQFKLPAETAPSDTTLRPVTPGTAYTFQLPNKLKVAKNFTIDVNDVNEPYSKIATVRVPSSTVNLNEGSITFTEYGADWDVEGSFELNLQMDGSKIGNTGSENFDFDLNNILPVTITVPFAKATPETKINPQKTVVSIDKKTNTVSWKIALEPTGLYKPPVAGVACAIPLQNALITDTFAATTATPTPGQTLVAGSIKLNGGTYTNHTITANDVTSGGVTTGFTAALPTLTTGTKYELTYQTTFDLSNANIFDITSGKLTLANDALVNYEYQKFGDHGELISGTQESANASKTETLTFIDKTGTHTREAKKGYITWAVTVNQNEMEVANPTITDVLPEKLTVRENSVRLYEGAGEVGTLLTPGDGTGGTYLLTPNLDGTSTLTCKIGATTNKKWKLTYITDVDERVYTGTEKFDAINFATFTGDGGISFTKTATVGVVKAGHMVDKTSTYNPADHIITWNITVNSVKAEIASGTTLTDTLPAGVTYIPGTLKVVGPGSATTETEPNGTTSGGMLELKWDFLGGNTTEIITVSFQTRVDDVAVWAKNSNTSNQYLNTATLTVPNLATYTTTHTPTIQSTLLEKKSLGYVQNGPDGAPIREITWQLDVNKDGMTMRDVTVTDTIHKDLEFVRAYFVDADGTEISTPAGVALPTAPLPRNADGTQSALVKLNAEFSDYRHIRVVTRVRPGLEEEFNTNPSAPWKVTNQAALTGEAKHHDNVWSNIPEISITPVEQQITSSVVKKYGEYDPNKYGFAAVGWSVDINRNAANLGTVVLEDDTNSAGSTPYLFLNAGSVKLYKIKVTGDGSDRSKDVTEGLVDSKDFTVEYNEATSPHQFTITIPNVSRAYRLEYTTDIAGVPDGNVTFQNTMKLKGTATGDASKSESSLSASFGSGSGSGSLPGFAEVLVKKTDKSGNPLAGAEFELRGEAEPTRVYQLKTDHAGVARLNTVRATAAGTKYVLTETKAPSGYALPASASQEVTLKKGGTVNAATITFVDPQILGTLTVTKKDKIDGTLLSGAEFTLTKTGAPSVTAVKTTDANGKATFSGLTIGDYTVTETAPPPGYEADAGNLYAFTVLDDQTKETQTFAKEFLNEKLPGTLTVHKKDSESSAPVSGAEFTLYLGNVAQERAVSGADGRAVFSTKLRDGQTYTVRETKAPGGYLKNDTPQSITINASAQTAELTFYNQKITGSIRLVKKDAFTGEVLPSGATFRLTKDGDASFPAQERSTSGGAVSFTDLPTGSYTVREITAPEGYVLDETPLSFKILEEAEGGSRLQELSRDVLNSKTSGQLTVIKVAAENEELKLSGAEFALHRGAAELERATTNGAGEAVFATPLTEGESYTVTETKSPAGYVADAAAQTVTIYGSAEQIKLTFRNKRILGTLLVAKQNMAGTALAGAQIGLYLDNEEETLVSSVVTGEDGLARFEKLTAGNYFYRELQAPNGYQLDTKKHPFTITDDGQIVSETLVNLMNKRPGTGGGNGSTPGTPATPPTEPPAPSTPDDRVPVEVNGKVDTADGDTVVLGTPPKNGSVVLNPDGTWSYTGSGTADSFTVIIRHPDGTTETVLVHIEDGKIPTSALPSSGGGGWTQVSVFGFVLVLCGAALRGRKKRKKD